MRSTEGESSPHDHRPIEKQQAFPVVAYRPSLIENSAQVSLVSFRRHSARNCTDENDQRYSHKRGAQGATASGVSQATALRVLVAHVKPPCSASSASRQFPLDRRPSRTRT